MTEQGVFTQDKAGSTAVRGPMTLATVTGLYQRAAGRFNISPDEQVLDLAEVTRVDSSGLALLLEWQAQKNRTGGSLVMRNAPNDLLRLANLCDAQDLLHINGRKEDLADVSFQ